MPWRPEDTLVTGAKKLPAPGTSACFLVLRGMNVGEVYRLDRPEMVIGRGREADINLPDDGASRRHAMVRRAEGQLLIEDLASSNGTHVNGERIQQPTVLREGDKIQVSPQTILRFTYQDGVDESFQRKMYESALRDSLTHAFNKKYFLDRLEREVRFSRRHKQPLTLVLFDIDHFKEINDEHGHVAGDQILSTLADKVQLTIRAEDVFARYGGEEFAVICRATDVPAAQAFAERLRAHVAAFPFRAGQTVVQVTISLGIAGLSDDMTESTALITAADDALYAAKDAGRNCSRIAEG